MKRSVTVRKSPCLFSCHQYDICNHNPGFDKGFYDVLRSECRNENITEEEVRFDTDLRRRTGKVNVNFRNRRRQIVRLLNVCCPVRAKVGEEPLDLLLTRHVPHYQVFNFLRQVSRLVFEPDVVFLESNLATVIAGLRCFTGLSPHGLFHVSSVTKKLKTRSLSERIYVTAFVQGFMTFARQLIYIFFYCTSVTGTNTVSYYRNQVWREISRRHLSNFAEEGFLTPVPAHEVLRAVSHSHCLGLGQLRLMPNADGRMRPICTMARPVTFRGKEMKPVNSQLTTLLNLFRRLRKNCGVVPGLRSKTMDELFDCMRSYKRWNAARGQARFFLVKCDVKEFYSNVDQDILLREMKQLFRKVTKVLTDTPEEVWRQQLVVLETFIGRQFVKCGDRCLQLRRGLSQGASVSPFLCHYYLLRMEKECLRTRKEDLLLRLMDDFLFVSPDRERARQFPSQLEAGLVRFKLRLNEEKVQTSFSGQDVHWLGFQLTPQLDVVVLPPTLTHCCKFGGEQLPGDACIDRVRRFLPNLPFYRPALHSSNSPAVVVDNKLALARILAVRVRLLVKTSTEKAELLGPLACQLANAIRYRLMKIIGPDKKLYRDCVKTFNSTLHSYRGEFHKVIRALQHVKDK